MIYTYLQALEQYHSDYRLKQAVAAGALYRIEKGIYADTPQPSELAILTAKYPAAIVTMLSAFYYHGLTDTIPRRLCLCTARSSRTLRDARIEQYYEDPALLPLGCVRMQRRDAAFFIYDRERMLIELLRRQSSLPYDLYKEVLGRYRSLISELDIERIQAYAESFPKGNKITLALEREVF